MVPNAQCRCESGANIPCLSGSARFIIAFLKSSKTVMVKDRNHRSCSCLVLLTILSKYGSKVCMVHIDVDDLYSHGIAGCMLKHDDCVLLDCSKVLPL